MYTTWKSLLCYAPQLQIFITDLISTSFGYFLSLYHWMLQLTVHGGTWCQCICPSARTCGLHAYVTFWLEDRGSMLHRSADMFVLWPNIPCQACLESCTEMYLKERSIKHVCRRWFEWQASTKPLISRRFSAVAHNCMTSQGRLL